MKIYFFIPIYLVSLAISSQNVAFERKNFPNDITGFKQAMDSIKAGDDVYEFGPSMYYKAAHYYLSAERFNPNNDQLNYEIGVCLLSPNYPFKTDALPYLQKAYKLNPDVAPDIHYLLGRAYHLSLDWEAAKKEYNRYMQTLDSKKDADQIADVRKKIEECDNGELLVKTPVRVKIENLGPNINTPYPEYGALVSADESELIFTSRRPTSTGGKFDMIDGQYLEDLYISYFEHGAWTKALDMGGVINSSENDATAGLSPDGQTLYIYQEKNGGDLYETHLKGSSWSKPVVMSNKINSNYHESTISIGPDGKTFYLVSDRPGGFGGRDIYKILTDDKGNWGDIENLGPVINTQYDEEGVTIQADGKTLYFSSKGHNTMGGYDIFSSVYENGHWTSPKNIGYPINTPDDDFCFCMAASGKHAYYSSIRKGGYGATDIYCITFLGDSLESGNKNTALNIPKLTLLKGIVTDSTTRKPIEASIELVDNKKNVVIASFLSNSATGKYLVSLPTGINYGIAVKADGYLFYSANFDIPDTAKYTMVERNISLQPLDVGSHIVLRNIFFDFDKATLRNESVAELNRVIGLLTKYPTLKIEIEGFTDSKGSSDYNRILSADRAKAVIDYLVSKGISSTRLAYKGLGMDKPIASNDTEEGRQLNRRTEIKIIGK